MAEQEEISDPRESIVDKIPDKIDGGDDTSSSSSSDLDAEAKKEEAHTSVKENVSRLFVREQPVQESFVGGTPADVFLWRDKKISAAVFGGATAVWVLFELLEYHLLTLVCHISILALSLLFLWSNASIFVSKRPPHIPQVRLPKEPFLEVASVLQSEINHALAAFRDIAAGRDLKNFLLVVTVLWALSIVGSCCSFLTLLYILFVVLHTVPVLYEKYDDKIDAFAEKAMMEIKKQYAVFDAKILSKIPRGPLHKKRV